VEYVSAELGLSERHFLAVVRFFSEREIERKQTNTHASFCANAHTKTHAHTNIHAGAQWDAFAFRGRVEADVTTLCLNFTNSMSKTHELYRLVLM